MSPLLEMRTITKEYRGVAAVKDVSFALENVCARTPRVLVVDA